MAGAAAPALGVGSKAATKVLGKVLCKAGMSEAMAAGTATVAGMAGEGGAIGSIMGGVGDLAAQGYDIHTGKQSAINWKQTGISTLTGGLTGFVMGGAFGAFSQTSAGKSFGKWMQEPTKLDIKAAEMVKSFAGNNRGSVNLGAFKGGSNIVNPKNVNFMQGSIKNQTGEHTVLENAEALKNGTLKASDLPEIKIWQDADGQLWTLDNRRLASFRLADLDNVPFQWATSEEVATQMWKMTTKTSGKSIKLKLGAGQSIIVE